MLCRPLQVNFVFSARSAYFRRCFHFKTFSAQGFFQCYHYAAVVQVNSQHHSLASNLGAHKALFVNPEAFGQLLAFLNLPIYLCPIV